MANRSSIHELLKKVSHYDADVRFMAVSDLYNELQTDVQLDPTMEQRICGAILDRLAKDSSNDVIAVSVKCLSVFMKLAHEAQVNQVCVKLSDHLLHGKKALRDIYSIGLKTLIVDVPAAMGPLIVARVAPQLVKGVSGGEAKVQTQCLEVLLELLKRFGEHLEAQGRGIMEALLRQLSSSSPAVRKRANACLGSLSVVLPDALLHDMVKTLLSSISRMRASKGTGEDIVRTLVQTIGTISRQVGQRMGSFLAEIVDLFIGFVGVPEDESQHTDEANDLRENCLQAFDSFVTFCPSKVGSVVGSILESAVFPFLPYDPNYTYMDDDEDMDDDDYFSGSDADSMYDSEGDLSADDDDTSWKVRRAAVRVLSAVIRTRTEVLEPGLFRRCTEALIERFKDRADPVTVEVLSCFTELAQAVVSPDGGQQGYPSITATAVAAAHTGGLGEPLRCPSHRSTAALLAESVPVVIREITKQLQAKAKKSATAKVAMWSMLRSVIAVLGPTSVADNLAPLLPLVEEAFTDRTAALRLEVLLFLRAALDVCPPATFHARLETLVPAVISCADDDWYKITAEALRIAGRLAVVVSPPTGKEAPGSDAYARLLSMATVPRLSSDVDQEIRVCAITASGLVLAHLGHLMGPQFERALPAFVDRLRNESTRLASIKALVVIAQSTKDLDVSTILYDVLSELRGLLRQNSRELQQATLILLTSIMQRQANTFSSDQLQPVLNQAASMISDSDLQLCHLALDFATALLRCHADGRALVHSAVLPAVLTPAVVANPLVQGTALASLLSMLSSFRDPADAARLADSLLAVEPLAPHKTSRAAIGNQARCIAAAATHATPAALSDLSSRLLKASGLRYLELLCLGELGRGFDLTRDNSTIFTTLLSAFDADSEDTKSAAAFALGGVCVGALESGLRVLLAKLSDDSHEYLLLSALKEVLAYHAPCPAPMEAYVADVASTLETHSESKNEGVRNMTAECMGHLAAISPSTVVPRLAALVRSESQFTRWTVATAAKYAASSASAREELSRHLSVFLSPLRDEALDVRRAGLLTLNAVIHHDVDVVKPLLAQDNQVDAESKESATTGLMDVLYFEMIPRKDLIREIDYGPFKRKVDDGLGLRKAAFACMNGILDLSESVVDADQFLPRLQDGLKDKDDDVQMQCHQLLAKLCGKPSWHGHLVAQLTAITSCLERVLSKMDRRGRGGAKADNATEVVRSAVRAIDALSGVRDAQTVKRFADMLYRVAHRDPLATMLHAVRVERGVASAASAPRAATAGAGAGAGAGARR